MRSKTIGGGGGGAAAARRKQKQTKRAGQRAKQKQLSEKLITINQASGSEGQAGGRGGRLAALLGLGLLLAGLLLFGGGLHGLHVDAEAVSGLERGLDQVLQVLLVGGLQASGASLQQLLDLLLGHLAGEVDVVLGQLVPQAQQDEDRQLHDGDGAEDRSLVLLVLLDLRLLVRGEVAVVDGGGVVVRHVVVLAENVLLAVDDGRCVHHLDVLAFLVVLQEAVEADVDEGEEVGHAEHRLQVEPEQERDRASQRQQRDAEGHVRDDAVRQEIGLLAHAVDAEVLDRGVADHVQQDAVHVEHEVPEAGAVKVPEVEGVADPSIHPMVDLDVRGSEVPRDIAEEHSQRVLEDVAHRAGESGLVELGVTLCAD